MIQRETLELVRAYYAISNAQVRRRIYDLTRSLAATDGGAAKQPGHDEEHGETGRVQEKPAADLGSRGFFISGVDQRSPLRQWDPLLSRLPLVRHRIARPDP